MKNKPQGIAIYLGNETERVRRVANIDAIATRLGTHRSGLMQGIGDLAFDVIDRTAQPVEVEAPEGLETAAAQFGVSVEQLLVGIAHGVFGVYLVNQPDKLAWAKRQRKGNHT